MSETANLTPEDSARLMELHSGVKSTRAKWLMQKAEAKAAKESYEGARNDLDRFLNEIADPPPLFRGEVEDANEDDDKPSRPIFPATPGDDSWRDDSLAKLGLPSRLLDNLNDAEMFTIGHLAAHSASGKLLTDIGGIGPAKAQKIEDALIAYWAGRPSSSPPAPESAP